MPYKEYKKSSWEILAKLVIVRDVLLKRFKRNDVAIKYSCHRNSVRNIINQFDSDASDYEKELVLSWKSLTNKDLNQYFNFLKSTSTKPLYNKRQASKEAENVITEYFNIFGFWPPRMLNYLKRKNEDTQYNLNLFKIKGVYKRNNFRVKKVRSNNWEHRHIYNYAALSPFEYLHYDTKHILDKHALPYYIYEKFKLNPNLPIYQWTIIDAYSRFRFLAYSNDLNSTFWIQFLLFTIMFIRSLSVDYHITIWTDWWSEFFSWSKVKNQKWNNTLSVLNAHIYSYDSSKDIRKNLVERSHRTDDEEFYIPRAEFIDSRKDFLKEATDWFLYYNFERSHSWVEMHGKTPYDKLKQSWLWNLRHLYNFPTLVLNDCICDLMYHTKTIYLASKLSENPDLSSPKNIIDFQYKLNIINNRFAQNVLNYYQNVTLHFPQYKSS